MARRAKKRCLTGDTAQTRQSDPSDRDTSKDDARVSIECRDTITTAPPTSADN